MPWKTPLRAVEHHVADHFRRGCVRHVVAEHHGHVGMRIAAEQVDAAQREIGALARDRNVELLAHQLAAGIDDEQLQLGVLTEIDADLAKMRILATLLLQDDPGQRRRPRRP